MRGCSECYLNTWSLHPRVTSGWKYKKAQLLILNATPNEDVQFYETDFYKEVIKRSGLNPDKIECGHIMQCSSKSQDFEMTTQQLMENAYYCRDNIAKVIEMVNPKAIVIAGIDASKIFAEMMDDKEYSKPLMKPFKTHYKTGIPVYHINSMKKPVEKVQWSKKADDLVKSLTQIKVEVIETLKRNETLNLHIVNTPASRKAFLEWFENVTEFAFDIETNCGEAGIYVDTRMNPCIVYTLAIGDDKDQWVIVVDLGKFAPCCWENYEEMTEFFRVLFEIGNRPDKYAVGQNGKFDNKFMEYVLGGYFPLKFDTMLAHHILDENKSSGLKEMATEYLGAPDYDIPKPIDFNKNPPKEVITYNAWDIYYTFSLFKIFREELKKDAGLSKLFVKVVMPCANALHKVERHGIYIDSVKLKQNYLALKDEVNALSDRLDRVALINWNSTKQLGELFFSEDGLGLTPVEMTKTGRPSVSEATLKLMIERYSDRQDIVDIIETLLTYRGKNKLTQFLISWEDYLDEHDRMHPRYLVNGTITGRLSCKDPNLQQVPRDPLARSCITAPEGFILGEADFSQAELRIAAELSGDQQMQMCFNTGVDIHRMTASRTMGVNPDEVSKADRKKAKAINFGFLYGMGAKKFRDYAREKYEVHITEDEARRFRKRFFELYSALESWHERQKRIVAHYGYVRNKFGRIRHLQEDLNSDDNFKRSQAERAAINSPVQGLASDMTQVSLARITNELPQDRIRVVGTVHDSILFEVREDSLDLCKKVHDIMTDLDYYRNTFGIQWDVPIEAEIKLGPWGMGEEYKIQK